MLPLAGCDLLTSFLPTEGEGEEECTGRRCPGEGEGDEGEGEEGEGEEGEGEGEGEPLTACTDAGCPEILELALNTGVVDDNTLLVVSAIVTDPDGAADIVGGSLIDPVAGGTYGTFAASGGPGAYDMSLTWSELNAVRAINLDGTAERALRARFFDQAGHEVQSDIVITLVGAASMSACDGICGLARCGGSCIDAAFNTTDNCGACGASCTVTGSFCDDSDGVNQCACFAQDLLCGSSCVPQDASNCGTCGRQCSDSCAGDLDGMLDVATCGCGSDSDCGSSEQCVTGACLEFVSVTRVGAALAASIRDGSAQKRLGICSNALSTVSAGRICSMLGEPENGAVGSTQVASTTFDGFLIDVDCPANATALSQCEVHRDSSCPNDEYAELTCNEAGIYTHHDGLGGSWTSDVPPDQTSSSQAIEACERATSQTCAITGGNCAGCEVVTVEGHCACTVGHVWGFGSSTCWGVTGPGDVVEANCSEIIVGTWD